MSAEETAPPAAPSGGQDATPQARMLAGDRYAQGLGMRLVESSPGTCTLSLVVREEHLNFQGYCHGGVTFALADMAFGLACNSRGAAAVGLDTHAVYTAAAKAGDVLTATAREQTRSRRVGTYRVEVARQDGTIVLVFTGTAYISG